MEKRILNNDGTYSTLTAEHEIESFEDIPDVPMNTLSPSPSKISKMNTAQVVSLIEEYDLDIIPSHYKGKLKVLKEDVVKALNPETLDL